MGHSILIMGQSGTGKSSSVRELDSKKTFIINVLNKPLPIQKFKKNYKALKGWDDKEGNYYSSDEWAKIIKCIDVVDKERKDIEFIIIDDIQYVLANEFMRRSHEHGFAKYTDLANHYWQIINRAMACRESLHSVIMSHSELDAIGRSKLKTIGKLLDEKITIEGMFVVVFHSLCKDGEYKFLTQNDGSHLAKSPMKMFNEMLIDNDLKKIFEKINFYYSEE